jgi:hypothetical protein
MITQTAISVGALIIKTNIALSREGESDDLGYTSQRV